MGRMRFSNTSFTHDMANITMSPKEGQRIKILEQLGKGELSNREAGERMGGISIRQVQRIKRRYEQRGIEGIVHKGRGKASNRKIPEEKRKRIKARLHEQYPDFGPTLASEMLFERDGIRVGKESVRQIQIKEGLHIPRHVKQVVYRSWRLPRASKGMLVQFDGSYEYWFEERGVKCCLLAGIDDATGEIMAAEFVEGNESMKR